MVRLSTLLSTLLKIVPLGIYLRAAACKFGLPVMGCDDPLCEAALGKVPEDGCTVTANTAELQHFCEHGWTPWLNGLLAAAKVPYAATCAADTGFVLLHILGAVCLVGWLLLWVMPQLGALWLTVYMGFGLHFHFKHLKSPASACVLELILFTASSIVLVLEAVKAENDEVSPPEGILPAKKPFGAKKKTQKAD